MHEEKNKKQWYAYIYGNPLLPTSYFKTNIKPEFGVGTRLVSIYTRGGDQHPDDFSRKLKQLIADALLSGTSQPAAPESTIVYMNY